MEARERERERDFMLQQELGVENQKGDLGEYKRSKLIDLGD
jgi:hypothetical protein